MRKISYFGVHKPNLLTPKELSDIYGKMINKLIKTKVISSKYQNINSEIEVLLKSCSDFAYSQNPIKYMEKFSSIVAWKKIRRNLAIILVLIQMLRIKLKLNNLFKLTKKSTA